MDDIKMSKFLSLTLRHKPHIIDIELDANGWADVGRLACQYAKSRQRH